MGCINKNLKDNQRLIQDFSETRVNQLFDEYFQDENPSYGEFISNPNVKEALGIIPISKVKSEIGKAFGKEISSRELKILKKSISNINDKLLGHSYKLFNIKQKGESDNYSWGLRKINSNINIQAKIDRLKQRINTGKQIRNLEDNQFNFPDINQTIKSNTTNSNKVELFNQQTLYQKQTQSQEGLIASEKTIRDLAARMSDRIGISVKFESDRTKEYKGKIENNVAYVNLAYATLDTPIHEILGHPIIRAIKNRTKFKNLDNFIEAGPYNYGTKENPKFQYELGFINDKFLQEKVKYLFDKKYDEEYKEEYYVKEFTSEKDAIDFAKKLKNELSKLSGNLYQNLLKELEYGKGAEVLDRIKRDYVKKEKYKSTENLSPLTETEKALGIKGRMFEIKGSEDYYTLEEQQEEAIVSLISEMIAGKIKETQNTKNLLTLLKKLLQQINDFIRSLINQKEIYIDKIPESNKEQLIESKLKQMIKDEIIRKECV